MPDLDQFESAVDSRLFIRVTGQVLPREPVLPRRLPPARIGWSSGGAPLGAPGGHYRDTRSKLGSLRLRWLTDPHRRQLAAMLTVSRFLDRALFLHFQARDRANAALAAMHALFPLPQPWPAAAIDRAAAAMAALEGDLVLTRIRTGADVALDTWPIEYPNRQPISEFLAFLRDPGTMAGRRIREMARGFEGFAAGYVGETSSIFVDLDGIGRYVFPGGLDPRGALVVRWAAWAVKAYVAAAKGEWGAARDAGLILDGAYHDVRVQASGLNVSEALRAAWRDFFGGRGREVSPPGQYAGAGETMSLESSPQALWLLDQGGLAAAFEAAS